MDDRQYAGSEGVLLLSAIPAGEGENADASLGAGNDVQSIVGFAVKDMNLPEYDG